jgi:hypothetical protein
VTKIAAAIYCERTGQKAILIGKQGAMLKQIGTAARKDIEGLLGTRVFLELFVKVQEEWRSSRGFVEELDWRRQLEQIAGSSSAKNRNAFFQLFAMPGVETTSRRFGSIELHAKAPHDRQRRRGHKDKSPSQSARRSVE